MLTLILLEFAGGLLLSDWTVDSDNSWQDTAVAVPMHLLRQIRA